MKHHTEQKRKLTLVKSTINQGKLWKSPVPMQHHQNFIMFTGLQNADPNISTRMIKLTY